MAWKNGSDDAPTTNPIVSDFFAVDPLDAVPEEHAARPTVAIAAIDVAVRSRRVQIRDAV
jgi:hypothetical protein